MSAPKTVQKNLACPAASSTPIALGGNIDGRLLLTFTGSLVGTVTVTAKVWGADRFSAVTNGAINLASVNYVYIPDIPMDAVNIAYSVGTDPLFVTATLFNNR